MRNRRREEKKGRYSSNLRFSEKYTQYQKAGSMKVSGRNSRFDPPNP
jgi:hypothetical protein